MGSAPDSGLETDDDIAVVEQMPQPQDDPEPEDDEEAEEPEKPEKIGGSGEPEAEPAGASAEPEAGEAASAWPEDQLERAVAALLFASSEPLSNARIADALEHTSAAHVAAALDRLSVRLVGSGLPFELVAIAGGWQLFSARDMADVVARFSKARREDKVSPAALETLA